MKITADEVVVLYLSQWKKHNKAHFYVPYAEFFKVAPRRLSSLMRSIKLDKSAGYFKKKDYVEGIKEFLEWLKSNDVEVEGEINFERVKEYVETARDYTQAMKYKEKKKGVEVEEKKEDPPEREVETVSVKKEVKVEEKVDEPKESKKSQDKPEEKPKKTRKLTGKLIEDMKRTASREKAIYMQNLKRAEAVVQEEKKEESRVEEETSKKKQGFFESLTKNWWILAIAGGVIALGVALMFMGKKKKRSEPAHVETPPVEYIPQPEPQYEEPKKEAVDWRELVGRSR